MIYFYPSELPAVVSLPHFSGVDPSLYKNIEGMNPNDELHETLLGINPVSILVVEVVMIGDKHLSLQTIGLGLEGHSRIQINIDVRANRYLPKAEPYFGMLVPIYWADVVGINYVLS